MQDEQLTPRERMYLEANPEASVAPETERKQLVGVSGWLGFLVASLILLGPVLTAALTAVQLGQTEQLYPEVAGSQLWTDAQRVTWLSVAAFCVICVFAGWRLLKHQRPSSVFIAIASLWVAGPALDLAGLAALERAGAEITASDIGAGLGRSLVWSTVWTIYLLVSRRVRNTYFGGGTIRAVARRRLTSLNRRQRQLLFFSACWFLLSFLHFQILAPLDRYPDEGEVERMWAIILLPPVLLWIGSWTYERFVGTDD